jgi:Raf kinase inhibitor-like YbhB/YbcL family protein
MRRFAYSGNALRARGTSDARHGNAEAMTLVAYTLLLFVAWTSLIASGGAAMAMTLTSKSFSANGTIPAKYTCEGDDVSPPLAWSDVPAGTRSLALVVDDPDAPDPKAPKTTWVHWVAYGIPPSASGLGEGASGTAMPTGAHEALNDWKRRGFGGPCPPVGRHRYFFKLYALDVPLDDAAITTKAALERAMDGHVVAEAQLVGTYEKHGAGR